MKKLASFLTIVTLLTSLVACGRRQDILNQIESEKAAESLSDAPESETQSNVIGITPRPQETVAQESGTPSLPAESGTPGESDNPAESGTPAESGDPSRPPETIPPAPPVDPSSLPNDEGYLLTAGIVTGDTGRYEGVTADELKAQFVPLGVSSSASAMVNTPTHALLKLMDFNSIDTTIAAYNKLTGNVTNICPDPLCRHGSSCLWKSLRSILYISRDHIYFTSGDIARAQLFRCALERNHVEKLDLPLFMGDKIWYAEGDKVYLSMYVYQEDSAGRQCFGEYDCKTGAFTPLSPDGQSISVLAVTGTTVWYTVDREETIRKTDIRFSKSEVVESLRNFVHIRSYTDEYLLLEKVFKTPDSLYHIPTGRLTDVRGKVDLYAAEPVFAGKYIYYLRPVSDAEIVASPLKDYYTYTFEDPRTGQIYSSMGKNGGRIFRMDLETGDEELIMELSYNGVPVHVQSFMVDGDAVYVAYLTHEDYHNYYNQDYVANNGMGITGYEPYRYLYVDMRNGTVNLLDPYTIG